MGEIPPEKGDSMQEVKPREMIEGRRSLDCTDDVFSQLSLVSAFVHAYALMWRSTCAVLPAPFDDV